MAADCRWSEQWQLTIIYHYLVATIIVDVTFLLDYFARKTHFTWCNRGRYKFVLLTYISKYLMRAVNFSQIGRVYTCLVNCPIRICNSKTKVVCIWSTSFLWRAMAEVGLRGDQVAFGPPLLESEPTLLTAVPRINRQQYPQ